jgi:tetratricopeptide (TPR) repeat protein
VAPLPATAACHLRAAEGWFELGNHDEAQAELEKLSLECRDHPDVLALRWQIQAMDQDTKRCMTVALAFIRRAPTEPRGWIILARTFYFRGEYQKAYDVAIRQVARFPHSWHLLYDAACYACRIGNLEEAIKLLGMALNVGDRKALSLVALDDPDFEALWTGQGVRSNRQRPLLRRCHY